MQWRKSVVLAVSVAAIALNLVEVTSYAIFFCHVTVHNNTVGLAVHEPHVIKQRNRTNAISMVGQLITWYN
jgi:hypothetical protein